MKVCNDHDYFYVDIPNNSIISKNNQGKKSMKVPSFIYPTQNACLKKRTHVKITLKNLIQKKKTMHTPSGFTFNIYKLFI